METQYKTEIFRPNPFSIIRDTFYPLVEKALSLDDYLYNYNSVFSKNKRATKLNTLHQHHRDITEGLKKELNGPLFTKGSYNWTPWELECKFKRVASVLFMLYKWQGPAFVNKHTGIDLKDLHHLGVDICIETYLQRIIKDHLIIPSLNGQCEEWLKEAAPKYKAIGYQFRTIVCSNKLITNEQWEQQRSFSLPDWERKSCSDSFIACFEPIPK